MWHLIVPLGLALAAPGALAESGVAATTSLEPCMNGAVSANGLFPTQSMATSFADYLTWIDARGLSRLGVFESLITPDAVPPAAALPSATVEGQFHAYMAWVEREGLSPFYAFTASHLPTALSLSPPSTEDCGLNAIGTPAPSAKAPKTSETTRNFATVDE